MDAKTGILLGAGGLALLALLARQRAEAESGADAYPYQALGGDSGGFGQADPGSGLYGHPQDPFGAPGEPGASGGWGTGGGNVAWTPSPEFERASLADQERTNALLVADNRRARDAEQTSAAAWAAGATITTGLAGTGLVYRALASRAASPAARVAAIRTSPSLATRVAPVARAIAPAARVAGPVAAGLAAGQVAVVGLEKSGALNHVANAARRAPVSEPWRQQIQATTAPIQYLGAVATGLAGRGTVRGNVGQVNTSVRDTTNRVIVAPIRNTNVRNFQRGVGRLGSMLGVR